MSGLIRTQEKYHVQPRQTKPSRFILRHHLHHLMDDLGAHRRLGAGMGTLERSVCTLLFWLLWADALGVGRHCIDGGPGWNPRSVWPYLQMACAVSLLRLCPAR